MIVVCYDMVDDTVGGGRAGCREVLHAGESFASSFPALPELYDCLGGGLPVPPHRRHRTGMNLRPNTGRRISLPPFPKQSGQSVVEEVVDESVISRSRI